MHPGWRGRDILKSKSLSLLFVVQSKVQCTGDVVLHHAVVMQVGGSVHAMHAYYGIPEPGVMISYPDTSLALLVTSYTST